MFFMFPGLLGMALSQAQAEANNPNPHGNNNNNNRNSDSNYPHYGGYNQYNYYYGNGAGGQDYGGSEYGTPYEYNKPDNGEPPPFEEDHYIQCFTCIYQVHLGHASGMENCNDPFERGEIPVVDCPGPCGVSGDVHACLYYFLKLQH